MGLFTGLALGAALAGGLAAGTKLGGRKRKGEPATDTATIRAPGTSAEIVPAPPPSAAQTSSEATVAARQASVRQRRRAAGAGRPLPRAPRRRSPAARLEPRTLGAGILGG